ncbi:hypothetical protein [Mycolicibacterium sp. CH28]|uniref:hypothetical protein n=1 Tax=Mycolicibacterium sp. CH28 TaxID=2512237 RepID=UPI00138701CF|nr:hypothetical protein [Mycolicibacterium sp. CH28]
MAVSRRIGSRLDALLGRDVVAQIQAHLSNGGQHGAVFDTGGLQLIVRLPGSPRR